MGDLSKNFSRHEFACRHCGQADIDERLINALQKLRDLIGKAIIITSGFRCEFWNDQIGAAKKSQHLKGRAADIYVPGMLLSKLAEMAEEVPAFKSGGIGIYRKQFYIHVDVRLCPARWDDYGRL